MGMKKFITKVLNEYFQENLFESKKEEILNLIRDFESLEQFKKEHHDLFHYSEVNDFQKEIVDYFKKKEIENAFTKYEEKKKELSSKEKISPILSPEKWPQVHPIQKKEETTDPIKQFEDYLEKHSNVKFEIELRDDMLRLKPKMSLNDFMSCKFFFQKNIKYSI
jgi:hypothetical protein